MEHVHQVILMQVTTHPKLWEVDPNVKEQLSLWRNQYQVSNVDLDLGSQTYLSWPSRLTTTTTLYTITIPHSVSSLN